MKDARYAGVRALLLRNDLARFQDILNHIPDRVVYTDIRMGYKAWMNRFSDPAKFSIDELRRLAALIEIDPRVLVDLILKEKPKKK